MHRTVQYTGDRHRQSSSRWSRSWWNVHYSVSMPLSLHLSFSRSLFLPFRAKRRVTCSLGDCCGTHALVMACQCVCMCAVSGRPPTALTTGQRRPVASHFVLWSRHYINLRVRWQRACDGRHLAAAACIIKQHSQWRGASVDWRGVQTRHSNPPAFCCSE